MGIFLRSGRDGSEWVGGSGWELGLRGREGSGCHRGFGSEGYKPKSEIRCLIMKVLLSITGISKGN
jgi:hypothetical protein